MIFGGRAIVIVIFDLFYDALTHDNYYLVASVKCRYSLINFRFVLRFAQGKMLTLFIRYYAVYEFTISLDFSSELKSRTVLVVVMGQFLFITIKYTYSLLPNCLYNAKLSG